jgi:hypothetical protein
VTEITDEIEAAIQGLNLSGVVRQLPEEEAVPLHAKIQAAFVDIPGRRWWWEGFTQPCATAQFADDNGFTRLPLLVPLPKEPCWFVAEDTDSSLYPIYEATPEQAARIIGECFAFEYYLVAKNLQWLICENHHGRVIGMGEAVVAAIEAVAT